jgi:hypothetical protein
MICCSGWIFPGNLGEPGAFTLKVLSLIFRHFPVTISSGVSWLMPSSIFNPLSIILLPFWDSSRIRRVFSLSSSSFRLLRISIAFFSSLPSFSAVTFFFSPSCLRTSSSQPICGSSRGFVCSHQISPNPFEVASLTQLEPSQFQVWQMLQPLRM